VSRDPVYGPKGFHQDYEGILVGMPGVVKTGGSAGAYSPSYVPKGPPCPDHQWAKEVSLESVARISPNGEGQGTPVNTFIVDTSKPGGKDFVAALNGRAKGTPEGRTEDVRRGISQGPGRVGRVVR
jgi:hypothetical protein